MAIDTENKRRSVSGYTGSVILPATDERISAADRAHVAGLYRGLFPNIGVLSFTLESMILSSLASEQIALSNFSSEQMAFSTLENENLEN